VVVGSDQDDTGEVLVSVRDTGVGIDPDHAGRQQPGSPALTAERFNRR
jgi:hypothetical protein